MQSHDSPIADGDQHQLASVAAFLVDVVHKVSIVVQERVTLLRCRSPLFHIVSGSLWGARKDEERGERRMVYIDFDIPPVRLPAWDVVAPCVHLAEKSRLVCPGGGHMVKAALLLGNKGIISSVSTRRVLQKKEMHPNLSPWRE